jgi:hypothetical protein
MERRRITDHHMIIRESGFVETDAPASNASSATHHSNPTPVCQQKPYDPQKYKPRHPGPRGSGELGEDHHSQQFYLAG